VEAKQSQSLQNLFDNKNVGRKQQYILFTDPREYVFVVEGVHFEAQTKLFARKPVSQINHSDFQFRFLADRL